MPLLNQDAAPLLHDGGLNWSESICKNRGKALVSVCVLSIKTPSAEMFSLSGKDVTFAGSFKLPVTLIRLLPSKRLLVTVA